MAPRGRKASAAMPEVGRIDREVLLDQAPTHWPPVQHLDRQPASVIRWRCLWFGCDQRWRYEVLVEHAKVNAAGHYKRAHYGSPLPDQMLWPNAPEGSLIYETEEFQ